MDSSSRTLIKLLILTGVLAVGIQSPPIAILFFICLVAVAIGAFILSLIGAGLMALRDVRGDQ